MKVNTGTFKMLFSEVAKKNNFKQCGSTWYLHFKDILFATDLQKSSFSSSFYVNFRVFINGCFGQNIKVNKKFFSENFPDIQTRPDTNTSLFLDLNADLDSDVRLDKINKFFQDIVMPFSEKVDSLEKICIIGERDPQLVTPPVLNEVKRILANNKT